MRLATLVLTNRATQALRAFFFYLSYSETQWLFELRGYGILLDFLSLPIAHTENTTMTLDLNSFFFFLAASKLPSSSSSRSSLHYVWSFVETEQRLG